MGYQVGRICYQTHEEAINVMMTQVVPTIDKDGVLHHPVFNGKTWVYKEQIIKPALPQCQYGEYAQTAREMGYGLIAAFAALIVVVVAMKAVGMIESEQKDEK
ncbi:MAG: hypothetical protein Q4D78_07155 [Neisseria zoodegmatis]|uniref:hypothetical protein n=1 Tax=Neisseria zoodegmatis TaxID=326523 RepID=UPI0026ED081D|nr:hypothetical protein [Neisseria zoodegmatis]MDO5069961.1 hypothetical protein [Neisseria zoodegmatis]